MKKFSTPWKNSRLHEKILDSKKKYSRLEKKIFSTRKKDSGLEKKILVLKKNLDSTTFVH